MEMIEMMDDQDGRDRFSSPSASSPLDSGAFLNLCFLSSMAQSGQRLQCGAVQCSQQQVLCVL